MANGFTYFIRMADGSVHGFVPGGASGGGGYGPVSMSRIALLEKEGRSAN